MKGNKKHINKLYLDACNSKHDELMCAENVLTDSQIYFIKFDSNNNPTSQNEKQGNGFYDDTKLFA